MTNEQPGATPSSSEAHWGPWLVLGWLVLIGLVVLAVLTQWEDLRLALDFERLFRP